MQLNHSAINADGDKSTNALLPKARLAQLGDEFEKAGAVLGIKILFSPNHSSESHGVYLVTGNKNEELGIIIASCDVSSNGGISAVFAYQGVQTESSRSAGHTNPFLITDSESVLPVVQEGINFLTGYYEQKMEYLTWQANNEKKKLSA